MSQTSSTLQKNDRLPFLDLRAITSRKEEKLRVHKELGKSHLHGSRQKKVPVFLFRGQLMSLSLRGDFESKKKKKKPYADDNGPFFFFLELSKWTDCTDLLYDKTKTCKYPSIA
ncbi:hypothetical protein CHARACLAT_004032 [Characodon lateralis]|uniref:Uncharacterized protein n=1 Tax=Characodon lateralis TaxID=208331 RepID=A0ABU7DDH7_9TELE|nr:hypothetical protein [Characodon lateralis]